MTRMASVSGLALLGFGLGGCATLPSVLDPQGDGAASIAGLFWLFTGICGAVWVLVMIGLAVAMRAHGSEGPAAERIARLSVSALIALTALILIVLTSASFLSGHSLAQQGRDEELTIKVTGHQWWWQVEYDNNDASRVLVTANEIHIPVGRKVKLELVSTDVIHSFWVPSLAGKMDLVPGRTNVLALQAERPGVYRGQCAEFCGMQHAHMGMLVIAQEEAEFARWYDDQLKPAAEPADPDARRGRDVFVATACALCHQIRGTPAGGRVGPELTHLASRRTLAAGTLPMSPQDLAGWIADPQGIKPGNNMPKVALSGDDLAALTTYLAGLK